MFSLLVGLLLLASHCQSTPEPQPETLCQNNHGCSWNPQHSRNLNPNNPFFNGAFEKLPSDSGFTNQEKVDISKNPFFNKDQKPIFPTAHPAGIVETEQKQPDLTNNPFLQNMFTANGTLISRNQDILGVQPKPFAVTHPREPIGSSILGDDDDLTLTASKYVKNCQGENYVCVPLNQCPNGVLPDFVSNGLQIVKNANQQCDLRTSTCCQLPKNPQQNNDFITAGKSSIPDSPIKFGGVPGFSPGVIQVVPVEINNAGEFGSSHVGESTQKPVRDISASGSNNGLLGVTPDYSNFNFGDDVRFSSSLQGPDYLPPKGSPRPPIVATPDLEVPISTYIPSLPTRKPFVQPAPKPFQPTFDSSVNNQFFSTRPKQPFIPSSTPQPTLPPYKPQSYQPTIPQYKPQPSLPTLQPYQPTISSYKPQPSLPTLPPYTPQSYQPTIPAYKPQPSPFPSQRPIYTPQPQQPSYPIYVPNIENDRGYLPPAIPTSDSNIQTQYRPVPTTKKPYTPPVTQRPRPPPVFIPSTTIDYLPPRTPIKVRPSPSSISPFTSPSYRPSPTTPKPTIIYQSSQPVSKYDSPTPAYTYPKPTSGYSYPTPTPAFSYPTTQRPLISSPSYNIPTKTSYNYPRPTPSPTIISTQRVRTTTPKPSPTAGYDYPKPTPEFKLPSASPTNVSPSIKPFPTTPKPSTPAYLPPSPTPGYQYPKPTPAFPYPDRDGASAGNTNQYIPPPKPQQPEQDGSDTSDTSVKVRPKQPEVYPDQSINNENVLPPSSCAAALKCVQEIYCTAEGFVSPVPVVLTGDQAQNRVPTTVCRDIPSGTVGVCCRDPNYKDPWPSANLVNGFDDGQYKEDDSIGQYKESLNDIAQYRLDLSRPTRSRSRRGPSNSAIGTNENIQRNDDETCGVRRLNTTPKGPGPLNTNFAEIPWQAMILRDSNRSLLCGGAFIRRNAVLTNAHCVDGIPTSDILVKGGEWKLGIDEEPLPFQIVKVSLIVRHPGYQSGSLLNDLAVLILEEKIRPSKNVGTICLPEPNKIPTRNCIATGWGKRILQLHAKGAVMRSIDVNIMDGDQCKEALQNTYQTMSPHYSPNTLCGFSKKDQCKVDYGSALACTNAQNQYILSGIFSWDTGCKDQNQIGGYVAPDVEWINDVLSKPVKVLKQLQNAQ